MPSQAFCTNEQKVPVTFAYMTLAGSPAAVEGQTEVLVTSGDATFERSGDHTGFLVSGPLAGSSTYSHTADADLGAGVVPIADSIELVVAGAQAAAVSVGFGTPVPK